MGNMAEILKFAPRSQSLDPEMLAVLVDAYDLTMPALHDRGQPEIVREIIAKRIIELAETGERDPERLSRARSRRSDCVNNQRWHRNNADLRPSPPLHQGRRPKLPALCPGVAPGQRESSPFHEKEALAG